MKKIIFSCIAIHICTCTCLAQNVGIGLTNPTRAKLEVNGAVGAASGIFGGDGHGISLQKDYAGIGFNSYYNGGNKYIGNGYAASQWLHGTTGWLAFDMFPSGTTNATAASVARAMTLTPQGHLGLGNASPNADLQFTNAISNRKLVLYESANNDNQYYGFGIQSDGTLRYNVDAAGAAHRFYAGTSSTTSDLLMTIGGNKKIVIGSQLDNAKMGINSNNPQYTLEIMQADHTGLVIIDPNTFNNWELKTELVSPYGNYLFFRYNGTAKSYIKNDGTYAVSDARLKNNIRSMSPVLDRIMQLQPSSYELKYDNPSQSTSIGFVAQDVKKYFPNLVDTMDGSIAGYKNLPDLHTINYSAISVLTVKAIQEQQQLIVALQNQVDALIKKVDGLQKAK